VAMAHHFLAEKEKVVEQFDRLIADIPDAARTADFKQLQKAQRGPNVYECYADWHLFGAEQPDYPSAVHYLSQGIKQAEFLHFPDDFRAPYVIRLRYKLLLAKALSPDTPAEGSHPGLQNDLATAEQRSDGAAIFAEARQVALAVVQLKQADQEAVAAGVEMLLAKIEDAKPATHLARNKLGLLLLAIEQVCDSGMLEPDQLRTVARKLNEIANVTSRGNDRNMTNFLRRYLRAVSRELTRLEGTSAGVDLSFERELIDEWLR